MPAPDRLARGRQPGFERLLICSATKRAATRRTQSADGEDGTFDAVAEVKAETQVQRSQVARQCLERAIEQPTKEPRFPAENEALRENPQQRRRWELNPRVTDLQSASRRMQRPCRLKRAMRLATWLYQWLLPAVIRVCVSQGRPSFEPDAGN